jgi:hypothetical protein
MNGSDVRMRQRGDCSGLSQPGAKVLIGRSPRICQCLDGDSAAKDSVFGKINDTHSAFPQTFNNPIVRDSLTNHDGTRLTSGHD